ncbi:thioredoxin family protein [Bacillus cihuensis]|uniref:thioredoxin family protein n=1 Tax=Bacillus cihuensis TaxID=1208599 RepID=UPI0003F6F81C|nr:thioredoxin family protein [Bacillus cihuensis]
MKKVIIFLVISIVSFGALAFANYYQGKKELVNNPYEKEILKKSTINQLDDPLYDNQILPKDLKEKINNEDDIVVYFYSPECVHCQRVTPVIVPMAEQIDIDLKKLNLLEFENGWNEFSIEGTPTIIHYKKGKEISRLVGENTKRDFEKFFNNTVQ